MGKQDPTAGRNWYVLHTYAGYEDSVEKSLRQRILVDPLIHDARRHDFDTVGVYEHDFDRSGPCIYSSANHFSLL